MPFAHATLGWLLVTDCVQPLAAALPTLQTPPWLGYYAVFAEKGYEFKITANDGTVTLIPTGEGAPVLGNLLIHLKFGIVATQPDGKAVFLPIRADTMETTDPATDKLGKSVIRGKTEGDAVLEITFEQSRGIVFVGSRVLEQGSVTHPHCGSVTVVFPNVNPPGGAESANGELNEREAKREAKKKAKEAKQRLKEDELSLKRTDGQRHKIKFVDAVDAGSKEINGTGIASAEARISAYGKRKFLFTASPESAMKLSNPKPASLSEGFSIQWSPDSGKNKDGKARIAIEIK
jgi:hypothetical protein